MKKLQAHPSTDPKLHCAAREPGSALVGLGEVGPDALDRARQQPLKLHRAGFQDRAVAWGRLVQKRELTRAVRLVMHKVDAGGGAVVLAAGVDGGGVEAAFVLRECFGREAREAGTPAAKLAVQVIAWIGTDEAHRQVERLCQEKPVIVGFGDGGVERLENVIRRQDVEDGQAGDALGMITRQAVSNASAPVVTDDSEALKPQLRHDLELILCHAAFGVGAVLGVARRFARVAVAAQVGHDNREALGEFRRDEVPHRMRLQVAVKQQDGWSLTAAK